MGWFEMTENTHDFTVIDRGFLHGDCVAAASDPTGQIGTVVGIHISVDLLADDGFLIKDKHSRELKRVQDFAVGDHVVLGPWLGRIKDVFSNVTMLLDDGSVCEILEAHPWDLKPVSKDVLDDDRFPYYPGQRVKASSSSVSNNSRWLTGFYQATRLEGTVSKVTVGSVFVHWIASAGYGPGSTFAPPEEQSPKNLKLLSCFSHTDWQLGHWCLHTSFESLSTPFEDESTTTPESTVNSILVEDNSEASCCKTNKPLNCGKLTETNVLDNSVHASKEVVKNHCPLQCDNICKGVVTKEEEVQKKGESFERALQIVNINTTVDVAWQNGTIKQGLKSTSLVHILNLGDHEFVPEQYIVEKSTDDSNGDMEFRRVGIVKSVDAKHRTACVKWFKVGDPREFDMEEVVSLYELEWHPEYDYWYGDVVVRLSPVSLPAKMESSVCSIQDSTFNSPDESMNYDGLRDKSKRTETISTHDISTDFSDLSWVGNIIGSKDGDLEVLWVDGMISTVGPQEIYVVTRGDYDEYPAPASDAGGNADNCGTFEDGSMELVNKTNEEHGTDDGGNMRPEIEDNMVPAEYSESSDLFSVLLAAFDFLRRLASGIFYILRGRKSFEPLNGISKCDDDIQLDNNSISSGDPGGESSSKQRIDVDHRGSKLSTHCEGKENNGNEVSDSLEFVETLNNLNLPDSDVPLLHDVTISTIKSFDIARNPFDHYFIDTRIQNNASRKWFKKVQQGWAILQNNLPEGIYVRAYEDRVDLLRAVIVGAYGTPYHDGLFSFDFHFPPEYPDVPPSAYYHSGGWRINPNLYEDGKVCLSLLNTWTGRGNEVWDPSTSSILQVLVSLQGLVLNSEPYYNEPGYDKQVGTAEGEKRSFFYNENTFILNCKMMMYLMRKPPKEFEEFVTEHFRNRGYNILKACDAYMKGHPIGSLAKDASITSDRNAANSTSAGFKLMLRKIVPKLFCALSQVGSDCQEFKYMEQYS